MRIENLAGQPSTASQARPSAAVPKSSCNEKGAIAVFLPGTASRRHSVINGSALAATDVVLSAVGDDWLGQILMAGPQGPAGITPAVISDCRETGSRGDS